MRLDRAGRAIEITDMIDGDGHDVRMAFHLGPDVAAELVADKAVLSWHGPTPGAARLELPGELEWRSHRGGTHPILGWYSAGLGERVPAVTLLGQGRCAPGIPLITRLLFTESENLPDSADFARTVSLWISGAEFRYAPEMWCGGQMSQQNLDMRSSMQMVRRRKKLFGGVTASWPSHCCSLCLSQPLLRSQAPRSW